MILCVDETALKKSPEVQKDVDLEDILNNHTKFFDNEEQALKENYKPLYFSTSIRSMYTNQVLKKHDGRYFSFLTVSQPFVHKGYDLLMYLTSISVMGLVDYALDFDKVMMEHSQFQPIGLYYRENSIVDPIILTHVILSDEGTESFKTFLKSGIEFVPISTIDTEHNIKALVDTLIEVKEVNTDEQK